MPEETGPSDLDERFWDFQIPLKYFDTLCERHGFLINLSFRISLLSDT